ncbi:MAG: sigma 54-interacting transcriptional regulator [Pseudomonadota bacterium]
MFPSDPSETIPESEPSGAQRKSRSEASVLGFVVLWSADEPAFLGAWLPVASSGKHILGRGPSSGVGEPARVVAVRQRPDGNHPLPAFMSPSLSKIQLTVQAQAPEALIVENVGRRRLFVNGQQLENSELRVGDVVDIGAQLTLLCAVRPPYWERSLAALHPFGEPDAHGFVGESPAAWRVRSELRFAASRVGHVLILGASGTGKELVAQAVHRESKLAGPLVARNAATLPESLIDAELFGNAKGYPNPGMAERKGMIGASDGGTLFLDEFADLPAGAQAHVLRVLDGGQYHRLGEDKARHSQFRLVAATNRSESTLRADVLARFDFRIATPELAQRREDIPLIALQLLRSLILDNRDLHARFFSAAGAPRLSEGFARRLVQRAYGANVRELRQLLWRALATSTGSELEWPEAEGAPAPPASGSPTEDYSLEQLKRALDANNGSLEKTWRALGLANRHVLNRLLRKYGLSVTKTHRRD